MWLFHLHSAVKIQPFSPVFPLAGSTAKAFFRLSLWSFKEKASTIFYNTAYRIPFSSFPCGGTACRFRLFWLIGNGLNVGPEKICFGKYEGRGKGKGGRRTGGIEKGRGISPPLSQWLKGVQTGEGCKKRRPPRLATFFWRPEAFSPRRSCRTWRRLPRAYGVRGVCRG